MRLTGHGIAFIPANPAFIDVRSLYCSSSDRSGLEMGQRQAIVFGTIADLLALRLRPSPASSLLPTLLPNLLALGIGHIQNDRPLTGVRELDRDRRPLALGDFLTRKITDKDGLASHIDPFSISQSVLVWTRRALRIEATQMLVVRAAIQHEEKGRDRDPRKLEPFADRPAIGKQRSACRYH